MHRFDLSVRVSVRQCAAVVDPPLASLLEAQCGGMEGSVVGL